MGKRKSALVPESRLGKLRFGIEGWLFRRGFSNPDVRLLVAAQLLGTAVMLVLGGAFYWYSPWPLWIGLGAALAVVNFYFLAKKLHTFFPGGVSRKKLVGALLNFYFRLFITGVVLFVFIAWFKAPIPALLIGLSLGLGTAIIFGMTKLHLLKSKEA